MHGTPARQHLGTVQLDFYDLGDEIEAQLQARGELPADWLDRLETLAPFLNLENP